MNKILFLTLLALLSTMIAACGNTDNLDIPDIIVPSVTIADFADPTDPFEDLYIPSYDEPTFLETDIPPFNEYNIALYFEPDTRMIHGMQSVRYTNRTDTALEALVFRVYHNAWGGDPPPYTAEFESRIFRHGRDYGFMDILHVSQDNEEMSFTLSGTVLTITLPRPLEPDETTYTHIQFEAYIPKIAHRTGANDYAVWAGAFLPVKAAFGPDGWHTEPYHPIGRPFIMDVANYIVEITTPIGYEVAGTGTKTEDYLDDRKVTTFTAQLTRDFAFAISPHFQRASMMTPSGNVEINLYYYSDALSAEHILNIAVEAMTSFEETIGAFPHTQLCIVETDMFRAGGEAFSSVIFMDSNHLRTSPTLHSLRNEIAHQWFSIIIGSNPLEETWLSGGLTLLLQEGLLDQPEALREIIESDHLIVQVQQSLIENEDNRRIASPLSSYETWSDYFLIQHRKARLMFYALYREMGEENFIALLMEYYRQFNFRIATSEDFIALAEEIHGRSLQRFFNQWLTTIELPALP
ncbi:MAG: M1 family metallopeptidase [Defluviitaleaceae bacterium]|nr:M1 family metallopeptidase [Defluviitaleaceae bacterium]